MVAGRHGGEPPAPASGPLSLGPHRLSARRHTARQKCSAALLLPPDWKRKWVLGGGRDGRVCPVQTASSLQGGWALPLARSVPCWGTPLGTPSERTGLGGQVTWRGCISVTIKY